MSLRGEPGPLTVHYRGASSPAEENAAMGRPGNPGYDQNELLTAARNLFTVVGEALIDTERCEEEIADDIENAHEKMGDALKPFSSERAMALRLDQFGVWIIIDDGTLLAAPQDLDGHYPTSEEWGEVSNPESQEFLDAINVVFRTDFQLSQFSGR